MNDEKSISWKKLQEKWLSRRNLIRGAAGTAAGAGLLLGPGLRLSALADDEDEGEHNKCKALARPIPDWFLRRTPDHHLLLDFYNINGIVRVVVLEDEGKLRIEDIRNSAGLFLEDIHAATLGDDEAPGLVRARSCAPLS